VKYLVTGGAGFIGSNIVEALLAGGKQVSVFDNFSTGRRENLDAFLFQPGFGLHEGDLRDYRQVLSATEGADYVLHQAALPSVPRSVADPLTTNEVNINGTLHVLQAARECGVKRVVFASSSSVYGDGPGLPRKEEMPAAPMSPYALSKYTAERYCQLFWELYGLETVCLRYFNVFGPRQDPASQYSAVIPKFISLIRRGERPVIYGDGLQSRDFTYVDNNVHACLLACTAAQAAGKVYNIACGRQYSLLDLVKSLQELTGLHPEPVFAPARPGDVKHSMADIRKAQEELGFSVRTTFRDGLQKMLGSAI